MCYAPPSIMPVNQMIEWSDADRWAGRFKCLEDPNPVLCNLGITLAHYELSLALRDVLGSDTGANFHTWAVWGSHKAGMTVRREDGAGLQLLSALMGGTVGVGIPHPLAPGARLAAGLLCAALAVYIARRVHARSAASVLEGNRIVLDDIGRVAARYVMAVCRDGTADGEALVSFRASIRPGPTDHGGQDLLKHAFQHYDAARLATAPNERHEHMLYANLLAILHEHLRLQRYIAGAIPRPLRRLITAWLLNYEIGADRLDVSEDVTPFSVEGGPTSLAKVDLPALRTFLTGPGGWDRSPDSLDGSAAVDWTSLEDRMNYIVDLFRSRHFDPTLYRAPFTRRQVEMLRGHGVDCRSLDR